MRRGDIGHIEGRILSHQDDVHRLKVQHLDGAGGKMIALFALHRDRARIGVDLPIAETEIIGQIIIKRVPPPLCFQRKNEGRIRIDVDVFDGVHLNGDR